MKKTSRGNDRSLISFRRLLVQYVMIFVLVIVTNAGATFWMMDLNKSMHDAHKTVFSLNLQKTVEHVPDSEIQEAQAFLDAKEALYEKSKKIIFYGLLGLSIAQTLYLLLISVIVYKRIKKNSQELEASVAIAENANKAKSMFFANVSHEIRTPLNAIIGFAEILNKELATTKTGAYADVIHKSANLLLSIINDILDISKIESGNITLENRMYDIKEMLQQTSEMYKIRGEEKGIHLVYTMDLQIPRMIRGDSLRLQQVISNLLSNAVKFTPEGGTIILTVECLKDQDEWIFLKFSVKDTGIGIPEEAQERIFMPFGQADGSVSRNFGGTGLGLAISQRILKMMQSKLELESYPRKGSNFFFDIMMEKDSRHAQKDENADITLSIAMYPQYLALLKANQRLLEIIERSGDVEILNNIKGDMELDMICLLARESVMEDYHTLKLFYPNVPIVYIGDKRYLDAADVSRFDGLIKDSDSEKIIGSVIESVLFSDIDEIVISPKFNGWALIAESSDANRLLLQILLEKAGLFVDVAVNGNEAIEDFEAKAYDIVFMDIHMPENEGIKAAKEILKIEKDESRPHAPMVAITENALKGNRKEYIRAGMDDYISKPISENHLTGILRKYISYESNAARRNVENKVVAAPVQLERVEEKNLVPYDPNIAAERAGIDRLTMDMLLENFYLGFDNDFDMLKTAVMNGNGNEIAETTNFLKASVLDLHFESGHMLLQEVEDHAKENRINAIDLRIIEQYFYQIKNDLNIK